MQIDGLIRLLLLLSLALSGGTRQDRSKPPPAGPDPLAEQGRETYLRRNCGRCHDSKGRAGDLFREGPLGSKGWWSAFLANSEAFRPASRVDAHVSVTPPEREALASYLVPFQHDRMRKRSAAMASPPTPPAAAPDLDRARELYKRHCVACHGEKGKGDGPLGTFFEKEPRPRSFVVGRFRRPDPSPEDIYLTITRGMPGSGMAGFPFLEERDRWSLAHFVLGFSPFPPPKTRLEIPDPPRPTRKLLTLGEELFLELGCRVCHGRELKGLNRGTFFSWADEAGRPLLRSRDLLSGIYRTGSDPRSLYREFVYGRGGTPMPSFATSLHTEERRWALVFFVRSLFDPELKRLRESSEGEKER